MADSTLDSELFVLIDNWPGEGRLVSASNLPTGGITGSTHHNVATAAYAVGEKLTVENEYSDGGQPGMSTFIYLQYEGTGAPTLAAKQLVVPDSATIWYQVTNDPDSCVLATGSALAAVAISAMTDAYYGWFWCGGVCPEGLVSALGGNYATEGNVVAGAVIAHDLAADAIGLGPCAGDTEAIIGFALADDA